MRPPSPRRCRSVSWSRANRSVPRQIGSRQLPQRGGEDRAMRESARLVVRFLVVAAIETLSLLVITGFAPGIHLEAAGPLAALVGACSVALVLALINGLVRPLLVLLTLPLDMATFGLSTLLVNGAMLRLA